MGKRGPKPGFNPKRRISESWSPRFAYAIGLLATDGCLSPPGHLIDLTSKEREQLENFRGCVGINFAITKKYSGGREYLRIQFKNALFYDFLVSIGLTPAKSKTLGPIAIPDAYFFHFLRGVFDGDGSTYSYWDPRWKSSFMYYLSFTSASSAFIRWLRETISRRLSVHGHVTQAKRKAVCYQLRYAKADALKIFRRMYKVAPKGMYLSRKRLKIQRMLAIVGEQL
ncbi:hypothetical protein HY418_02970 [Candidatus Kaiserbacteria bacterium]|nr:hypothetical protein [Candidatus Kaiserbacteria bacterium]